MIYIQAFVLFSVCVGLEVVHLLASIFLALRSVRHVLMIDVNAC